MYFSCAFLSWPPIFLRIICSLTFHKPVVMLRAANHSLLLRSSLLLATWRRAIGAPPLSILYLPSRRHFNFLFVCLTSVVYFVILTLLLFFLCLTSSHFSFSLTLFLTFSSDHFLFWSLITLVACSPMPGPESSGHLPLKVQRMVKRDILW
jgi:hypothetical protein